MHPEIEKLIDLAFSTGEFNDAKKQIILKKAEALGLDSLFVGREYGLEIYLAKYPNLFIQELNLNKDISQMHRAKDSLIKISQGHLF